MNLLTTIRIWAGGEGSGCHGPNCGRPKVRLEKVASLENVDKESSRSAVSYRIKDDKGNLLGSVVVKQQGDELEVSWVSGTVDKATGLFNDLGAGVARGVVRALKELYPSVKRITGDRMTGIHYRTGTTRTQVAWE